MKWLFILLVAINIAVFGGTVGYKLAPKQASVSETQAVKSMPATGPVALEAPEYEPDVQTASESDTGVLLGASDILTEEQAEQLRLKKEGGTEKTEGEKTA